MRTWSWVAAIALIVGCKGNPARDCAPYVYDPVLEVCACPEGTRQGDGGGCFEYDGGTPPLDCPGGAVPITVYADADGDGHGNPATERMGCPAEPSTATIGDDCDDTCPACHPGGTEVCDGADNDCSAGPDDTFACIQGTATACTTTCATTGTGSCSDECAAPAACTPPSETCNEIDDDCDALVDEGTLGVGAAVPWPTVSGYTSITAISDGFVVLYTTTTGDALWAQRFSATGEPTGVSVMITAGAIESVDSVLVSDTELAYVIEEGDRALVGSVDPRDLDTIVTAREIATRAGLWGVRIVKPTPEVFVLYGGSSGAIYARALLSLESGTASERTVIASRLGVYAGFDVTTRFGSLGQVYVVYEDTPVGETDPEIFAITASSSAAPGPRFRLTDNTLGDTSPTVEANRSGSFSVGWIETPDESATLGEVRVASLTHDGSGWTDRARSIDGVGRAFSLLARQLDLIEDARGWLITYTNADAGYAEQRMRYLSPDMLPLGAEIVPQAGAEGLVDLTLGLRRVETTAWLVTCRARGDLGDGAIRAFPLGCLGGRPR